ncbi:MAG: adenosylcobinamide-GDP ribazoletransferase [Roseateles depolymerans]|uniref:Adenosylcobinamide-GDP ribazoletransferase n=1 Tax=Roseateles depolymerans TaxID=76731 RepID=A0A2W5FAW0_9BURK|nr:MAG: adenosylcobinamide-GDP ribazoletransferase [Roseateles depolymerans]
MPLLRLFFTALQFLTRLPIPKWVGFEPAWLARCAPYFVPVGALVGALSGAVLWAACWCWSPLVAVVLAMAAGVYITGGFHEDGLADTCDGLGGAVTRDKALTIMKDSRLGSYGALGLVLVLGLKAAVLLQLAQQDPALAALALVWSQAVSRALPVMLMASLPYAGDPEHAKAKPLASGVTPGDLALTLAFAALACLALVALRPELLSELARAVPLALLLLLWLRGWLARRLGGYTGDTLGASQQLGELALLLGLAAELPLGF